jgi:hypothetical protein
LHLLHNKIEIRFMMLLQITYLLSVALRIPLLLNIPKSGQKVA